MELAKELGGDVTLGIDDVESKTGLELLEDML